MATEDRSGVTTVYRPGAAVTDPDSRYPGFEPGQTVIAAGIVVKELGANLFRLFGTPAVPPSSGPILADAGSPRGGEVRTTIRAPPEAGVAGPRLCRGLGEARTGEETVRRARFGRIVNDQNQDTRR